MRHQGAKLISLRIAKAATLILIACAFAILPTVLCAQGAVYDFQVPTDGYDRVGNVTHFIESINGVSNDWFFQYDPLNRLSTGSSAAGYFANYAISDNYDSFGNRTLQTVTHNNNPTRETFRTDFDSTGGSSCHAGSNRICATSQSGILPSDGDGSAVPAQGMDRGYDAAGNLLSDGVNYYRYDAEGRLCASYSTQGSGVTQYFYDAEGVRVAKATADTFNCPGIALPPSSKVTAKYLLGPSGEQVTELAGDNTWRHTNVYAGGGLLATYDTAGLHFLIADPVGTKKMDVLSTGVSTGQINQRCYSLAFGDGQFCDGPDATEHHFTGKERDPESGLDYFGARYLFSNAGRWASADKPFADQRLVDPQSLNLYQYASNNPLRFVDPTGRKVIESVVATAIKQIQSSPSSVFYLDFAGIRGPHTHESITSSSFDGFHGDHTAANSVVLPNKNGFIGALFGRVDRDQKDTAAAIYRRGKSIKPELDFAVDTYSNGVNGGAAFAAQIGPDSLVSATVVAPNTASPDALNALDSAVIDSGSFDVYQSTFDPALNLALFGSQAPSDIMNEFGPDKFHISSQASHDLQRYLSANHLPN